MKTMMMLMLILGSLGTASAFASELCGRDTPEGMGGDAKVYFITNDDGKNVVVPATAKVKADLDTLAYQSVCAQGKKTRKGFVAASVSATKR